MISYSSRLLTKIIILRNPILRLWSCSPCTALATWFRGPELDPRIHINVWVSSCLLVNPSCWGLCSSVLGTCLGAQGRRHLRDTRNSSLGSSEWCASVEMTHSPGPQRGIKHGSLWGVGLASLSKDSAEEQSREDGNSHLDEEAAAGAFCTYVFS